MRFIIISVSIHAVFLVFLSYRINIAGLQGQYRINEIVVHLEDETPSGFLSQEDLIPSDMQENAVRSYSDVQPVEAPAAAGEGRVEKPPVSENLAEDVKELPDMPPERQSQEEVKPFPLVIEEKQSMSQNEISGNKNNPSSTASQNRDKDMVSEMTMELSAEKDRSSGIPKDINMETSLSEGGAGRTGTEGNTGEDGGGFLNTRLPAPLGQPSEGTATGAKKDGLKMYISSVTEAIRQNTYYPPAAKRSGIKGKVVVSFLIRTDGTVSDIKLTRASGYSVLDDAAIRIMGRVSPLSPPPSGEIRIEVPVVFTLKDW